MVNPRRHARSRLNLEGDRVRCPASTNCSISQALASGTEQREIGSRAVIISSLDPIRIPEIELSQIPLQVGLGYVLVDAVNTSLEVEKYPSTVLV